MARPLEARKVKAVLWKKLTATNADAMLAVPPPSGTGGGARHIPLRPALNVGHFLGDPNPSGGTAAEPEFAVRVESPGGEVKTVPVAFDLRGAGPRREWRIRRQNDPEYHPAAWHPGGKLPGDRDAIPGNYLMLIRLADGSFHARVATPDEVLEMPAAIRDRVLARVQGILEL